MIDKEIRREQIRQAQMRYRATKKGKEKIKEYRSSEVSKAIKRRWYHENTYKDATHKLVRKAIKAGRLNKMPCEFCGEKIVHAHHDDYNKPLDVRWLCPIHHKAVHPG